MANQPDTLVMEKQRKKVVGMETVIPSDGNIRKLEKYQRQREELEDIEGEGNRDHHGNWNPGYSDPELGEWLQQIPGTAKMFAGPSNSSSSGRRPELEWVII